MTSKLSSHQTTIARKWLAISTFTSKDLRVSSSQCKKPVWHPIFFCQITQNQLHKLFIWAIAQRSFCRNRRGPTALWYMVSQNFKSVCLSVCLPVSKRCDTIIFKAFTKSFQNFFYVFMRSKCKSNSFVEPSEPSSSWERKFWTSS